MVGNKRLRGTEDEANGTKREALVRAGLNAAGKRPNDGRRCSPGFMGVDLRQEDESRAIAEQ